MNNGYLHCSIIFKASNLNYGESIGNILSLKKLTVEEKTFSYISRQALRYDIVRILDEECRYGKAEVDKAKGVIQFTEGSTIDKYPEIDFFGYMKTEKKSQQQPNKQYQEEAKTKIRKAVVRLTDAVSLEPFYSEMDFSTNMGLASRKNLDNDIYQSEIHKSYYTYSITIDLDKVGIDENYKKPNLNKEEKIKRLNALLYAIKVLNRDIKGKRENLSPLFIIGGIYTSGNPFFYNQIKLLFSKDGISINDQIINSVLEITMFNGDPVRDKTYLGFLEGHFNNVDKISIENDRKTTIEKFFESLKNNIANYYGD
ncbi:CRISPR-associated negative autoregulator [Desulfurella amilsii]|uniref:CRISPR-associated negative autoregulator n=1 Tax=Desulfurella amilsii TaxID=1562698 RepID=A0A1X4XVF4_9BACT|nr:type I-B CRISPR-associated protein Cas7/Cst2/DevR [Desulfurella amilsii]OSS41512.1 CRISPR-associated negative autoregulator [Desulfurella amilsii]